MTTKKKPAWIKYIIIAVAITAAYFVNVEVQTHLGKKAIAESGIQRYPLDEALLKAQAENKLVLAELAAIWCPTCRNMDKTIFSNQSVQTVINEKYILARMEYESEEGEAFMKAYDARGFPTLLVLDPFGEKIRELPVTTVPEEFIQYL